MGKPYKRYSSEVRQAIAASGDPSLFPELRIPRSTAYYWIANPPRGLTTIKNSTKVFSSDTRTRIRMFLQLVLKCLPDEIDSSRLSEQEKVQVIHELDRNRSFWAGIFPLALRTKIVNRLKNCESTADGLCIRRYSGRLTFQEVRAMRSYVESQRYAHLSIASLVLVAGRHGDVCNSKTWYKYIKKLNWHRPSKSTNRQGRRVGLRAERPHQYWHVDASIIKTNDGTKNYLQVVIDNYSRFILAWRIGQSISGFKTAELIANAKKHLQEGSAFGICSLISDGGPENRNRVVNLESVKMPMIRMRLAKREIWASNSMVESFFKALKHQYLKSQTLADEQELRRHVDFYINEHNQFIPYAHLDGHTPEESLTGKILPVKAKNLESRKLSLESEVEKSCRYCRKKS